MTPHNRRWERINNHLIFTMTSKSYWHWWKPTTLVQVGSALSLITINQNFHLILMTWGEKICIRLGWKQKEDEKSASPVETRTEIWLGKKVRTSSELLKSPRICKFTIREFMEYDTDLLKLIGCRSAKNPRNLSTGFRTAQRASCPWAKRSKPRFPQRPPSQGTELYGIWNIFFFKRNQKFCQG